MKVPEVRNGGDGTSVGGDGASVGGDGVSVGGDGAFVGGDGTSVGGYRTSVGGDGASVGGDGTSVGGDGRNNEGYGSSVLSNIGFSMFYQIVFAIAKSKRRMRTTKVGKGIGFVKVDAFRNGITQG
jgi:hypothetical protein